MSEVVQEIRRQLVAQGVNLSRKVLVKIDDNTLRVHTPSRRIEDFDFTSVDIKYDQGKDLYDVSVHKGDKKSLKVKTCKANGIFFDSLPNFFEKNITKTMKCGKFK